MQSRFTFRASDTVGVADAESDQQFLAECFVDTGTLELLMDGEDPRRIVLGRTGTGKTALLGALSGKLGQQAIAVQPESLALSYISNSTILQFVHSLGVSLDIFFRLLWRHVFTVEIIKAHFHLDSPEAKPSVLERIRSRFDGRAHQHQKALEYLENWGASFWEQTDYRIRELTTKLENDLRASLGAETPAAKFSVLGARSLTAEQKAEVVDRAQHVVNQVQIQELSHILDLLDQILGDPKRRYCVVIDRLDENWIEERLRYLLIRALIETTRDFAKVRNVKIVIALRYDLLDRVMRMTRDAGFQEEKYESLYLELRWAKEELADVLDRRVSRLIRQRYTGRPVTAADVLPEAVNKVPTLDYMMERTLMRPRDIITFFNCCIKHAKNEPTITARMIREAEGEYSRQRLRSIADEWSSDFPELAACFDALKGRKSQFCVSDVSDDQCLDAVVRILDGPWSRHSELSDAARGVDQNLESVASFRALVIATLYRVGIVGLKLEKFEGTVWAISERRSISVAEVSPGARVCIHPCFWRTLGVTGA